MTTTPTNSTVSAEQAREAVEFFAPKGVIYTAARAGQVCAHRTTLERFIAQHSTEPVAETIAALRRRVEEVADLLGQPFHIVADRQTVMRAEQMLRAALRQAETEGGG